MLYTEDFTMRHYVGFLQIGSHIIYIYIYIYIYMYAKQKQLGAVKRALPSKLESLYN